MYFLLKIGILQPAMLVYQRVFRCQDDVFFFFGGGGGRERLKVFETFPFIGILGH